MTRLTTDALIATLRLPARVKLAPQTLDRQAADRIEEQQRVLRAWEAFAARGRLFAQESAVLKELVTATRKAIRGDR